MASKYASLKGKVAAFEPEPEFQKKVEAAKREIVGDSEATDANVSHLAMLFAQHQARKHDLEEQISDLNIGIEAISQLIVESLEGEDISSVKLDSGATVYLSYTPYPSVEDREKVMEWIKKNKMKSLLSVNYQTMKAMVSEQLAAGKPTIPGIKVFLKSQARILNGRKGATDGK